MGPRKKKTLAPYGLWLVGELKSRGMAQADLAKSLGISRQYVSGIINGTSHGYSIRLKIESALGVKTPDELAEVPKKRGRPKTRPQVTDGVPRKRGRPRTRPQATDGVPRKRGRPRKSA